MLRLIPCQLRSLPIPGAARPAANQRYFRTPLRDVSAPAPACLTQVRLLRRAQETDRNRFVLSGRLADVCQALDHMLAQEQAYARR